ncbi:MAG: VOC family protein [Actinomycetales bacterium]|nr:VOC family protein [Actinomycetales bacterium]
MGLVDGVLLEVGDLARSIAFYRALGVVVPDPAPGAGVVVMPGRCRVEWVGCADPSRRVAARPVVRVASPAEVDAVVGRLRRAGHRVVAGPFDAPWGARIADIADPDGGLVRVQAAYP